jgi:N-acetylmuramoyl-L-alanine amidase
LEAAPPDPLATSPRSGPAGAAPLASPPGGDARQSQPLGGRLTIVIDPGHGGKDTGAIGPRGSREKDIVLDIALRLRRLLADRLGAHVIMTRTDDTFVPLEERTGIAKTAQADFFISIHVNAAQQARATGVETYYLSREPSDGDARASAARENLVMNLEGIGAAEQEGLKAILWDMAQTLHIRESSALAEILLEDLGRGLRVETRGVKHGPFVVLMTAGMPSTLVEVGFLSNPQVERRLQEETFRQQIAAALSQGIEKFAHRYQRRIGMQAPRPGPS